MDEQHWLAPEYQFRPKTILWYWVSIGLGVLLVMAAVWQKNFLFAFFVIVAEMLVLVWGSREPNLVQFSLDDNTFRINRTKIYRLSQMSHWSAHDVPDADWVKVWMHSKKTLNLGIRMYVPAERWPAVRAHLRARVPEVDHDETLFDILEEFLGF